MPEIEVEKCCETCRYLDEWHKKRKSCFPWIPRNHACYSRYPQECGPRGDWSRWRSKKGIENMTDEEYWKGIEKDG